MPKLEIDGQEITVEDGLNLIQAAERLGIEVPHYCYHPGLSISGNCRMCLVEIDKMPKLQIACNTKVTEGMVVKTTSPKAKAAQAAVLEFILINHPIDCPICDQAGECKLQDYYMDYGKYRSQMPIEAKIEKKKVDCDEAGNDTSGPADGKYQYCSRSHSACKRTRFFPNTTRAL